jgi:hypothetical protein
MPRGREGGGEWVGGEHDDDSLPPLLGEKACEYKEVKGRGQWGDVIAFIDQLCICIRLHIVMIIYSRLMRIVYETGPQRLSTYF